MAIVKSMQNKPDKFISTPQPNVDMDFIEYLYVANFNDILSDDKILEMILNNGYYKTAFCDAFNIDQIELEHKDISYKLSGMKIGLPTSLDIFYGRTKIGLMNTKVINKKLGNINQITPRIER